MHLGPRKTWGTAGHLNAIWGIIENVPREARSRASFIAASYSFPATIPSSSRHKGGT